MFNKPLHKGLSTQRVWQGACADVRDQSKVTLLDWFDYRSVRRSFFRRLLHRRCVLLLLNFAILRRSLHVSVSMAYLQCSSGTSACKVSVANSLIVGVRECPFGTKAAADNLLDHVTPLTVTLSHCQVDWHRRLTSYSRVMQHTTSNLVWLRPKLFSVFHSKSY